MDKLGAAPRGNTGNVTAPAPCLPVHRVLFVWKFSAASLGAEIVPVWLARGVMSGLGVAMWPRFPDAMIVGEHSVGIFITKCVQICTHLFYCSNCALVVLCLYFLILGSLQHSTGTTSCPEALTLLSERS